MNFKMSIPFLVLMLFTLVSYSQKRNISVAVSGYTGKSGESSMDTYGWKAAGKIEFYNKSGKLLHGVSLNYMQGKSGQTSHTNSNSVNVTSIPLIYEPKYLVGSKKFKPYLKGALGINFSFYESDYNTYYGANGSSSNNTDKQVGFYGGIGCGLGYIPDYKVNIFMEYQWNYLTDKTISSTMIHTVSIGAGYIF